jgi:hypothetical protein
MTARMTANAPALVCVGTYAFFGFHVAVFISDSAHIVATILVYAPKADPWGWVIGNTDLRVPWRILYSHCKRLAATEEQDVYSKNPAVSDSRDRDVSDHKQVFS